MSGEPAPTTGYVNSDEAGGNVYDKYASQNPIERRLVAGFLADFDDLVARSGARRAHEVGCGEGELALRMARAGLEVRGSDAFAGTVEEARRRAEAAGAEIGFECKPVQELTRGDDGAELVVCCEVLEHLEDPEAALEVLAALAQPWLIASVPREPLWRGLNLARFAYVAALGNTPGHVQHWSKRGFRRFLERRLEIVELRSPLPWTMALCRGR
ncbi:MAG TPA: methyltransferase domain-containing protein [Solirubrobacterales bacterium]|nr:methyltransferase domain-containing protein [Solirubrobacterales bacterium]